MELAEYEERCLRDAQKEERLAFLRDQIVEQKQSRDEWNKSKYGAMGNGFFESFGRDCR